MFQLYIYLKQKGKKSGQEYFLLSFIMSILTGRQESPPVFIPSPPASLSNTQTLEPRKQADTAHANTCERGFVYISAVTGVCTIPTRPK